MYKILFIILKIITFIFHDCLDYYKMGFISSNVRKKI